MKILLSFFSLFFFLTSCNSSKEVGTVHSSVYPILMKNAKKSKVAGKKYFVVTKSGEEIVGTRWKLRFHGESSKPADVTIGGREVLLDSIISFQNYDGHASRFATMISPGKASIDDCFAYYIRKGSKINLLHNSKTVFFTASGDARYESVFYMEFLQTVANEEGVITFKAPNPNEKILIRVDFNLLSRLSKKNDKTKEIFAKNKKGLHVNFSELIKFVDAYNM